MDYLYSLYDALVSINPVGQGATWRTASSVSA